MKFFQEPKEPIPTDIVHERQDFDQTFRDRQRANTPVRAPTPRVFNITSSKPPKPPKPLKPASRQNTVKIPTSVLKKMILHFLKRQTQTESISQLLRNLELACMKENQSTPVKLFIVARKAGCLQVIQRQFKQKAEKHINKLRKRNRWELQQFNLTREWCSKVQKAIEAESVQQAIEQIWINHNHSGKKEQSERDVAEFIRKIEEL